MAHDTSIELEQALAACANEPIRYSGGIQPHGYLLSCDAATGVIRHASRNCAELLEVEAEALIGLSIDEFLHLDLPMLGEDRERHAPYTAAAEYIGSANIGAQAQFCDVSLHIAQGLAHFEVEPQVRGGAAPSANELVHGMIFRIGTGMTTADQLHATVAEQARALTGFDRVMIYRFLPDDTGEVIAESLAEGVQSYLGLRYPASDIPPQARALYLRNRVRVIARSDYAPSPIVPAMLDDGQPLDLSLHGLRSVSPVHLEYMRNMGMAASMSVSIIVDGRLWGLIACHHRTPRQLSPRHRTAADLLGMFYSLRVASMQHLQNATRTAYARSIRTGMIRALSVVPDPSSIIATLLPDLREMIPADAVLYLSPHGTAHDGEDVDDATLAAARAWRALQTNAVAFTHAAADWQPAAATGGYAGLMSLRLHDGHELLLLRREQVAEVNWAGEPIKDLVATDDGVRMAPRRSFNVWRETVRGESTPWQRADLDDAEATTIVLRQALARSLQSASPH